jgi:hypothetical protein
MPELKTKPTKASVAAFLRSVEPEQKRADALALLAMFEKATGEKPVMWGESIVGFGKYRYESSRSAQKGEWPMIAFSPRKANLTLYILAYDKESKARPAFDKLGKHKLGGGCLCVNKLADVDKGVLAKMIRQAWNEKKKLVGPKRTIIL